MGFSVYVHAPFCKSRCPYCAFYSGEPLDLLPPYASQIVAEIVVRARRERPAPGPVDTVYFGGGTPSLLEPDAIGLVLTAIDHAWGLPRGAEVTLEANPADELDPSGLLAAGVNRLSLGVQSLDDSVLAWLGRRHRTSDTRSALETALVAGFTSLSADLLFGLPVLDPRGLALSVRTLREFGVGHISTYSLEIHPQTPLAADVASGRLPNASAAEEEEQWASLDAALRDWHFQPYEISNYCRPGAECRHNLSYWTRQPYVGLGPGAHSFAPAQGLWGARSWNSAGLVRYQKALHAGRLPPGGEEHLSSSEALLEALFLALRRPFSIDFSLLSRLYEKPLDRVSPRLRQAAEEGLLKPLPAADWSFRPTCSGMRTADGLSVWLHEAFVALDPPRLEPGHAP